MNPPEKRPGDAMSEQEIDELYGLEPVLQVESSAVDNPGGTEFVTVACPYCGESFGTGVDLSAGSCVYVEDCQICCQPIEMELRVDEAGKLAELVGRRGDS